MTEVYLVIEKSPNAGTLGSRHAYMNPQTAIQKAASLSNRKATFESVAFVPATGRPQPIDGNEIWEALMSICEGDVPAGMGEATCQKLAEWINFTIFANEPLTQTAKPEIISADDELFDNIIHVPTKVTDEMIANTVVGWLESPQGDHCNGYDYVRPFKEYDRADSRGPYYAEAGFWAAGNAITLTMENPNAGTPTFDKVVTRKDIVEGIRKMALLYPHHLSDFVTENGDADTDDTILQCTVYGELVYG